MDEAKIENDIYQIKDDIRAIQRTLKAQDGINTTLTSLIVKWFSILVSKNLITAEDLDMHDVDTANKMTDKIMDEIKNEEP